MRRSAIMLIAATLTSASSPSHAQPMINHDRVLTYTVQQGTRSRVWFVWGLLPDCSTRRGFNVRVVTLPRHGTASLEKTNEVVSTDWVQPFMGRRKQLQPAHCIGRTAPVISVFYNAKPGFRGEDSMAIVATSARVEMQNILRFQITVR